MSTMRERDVTHVQLSMPSEQTTDQPITDKVWQSKGLWEKLGDLYHERHRDPVASKYTDVLSISYFWFTLFSWIYLTLTYYIPEHYPDLEPITRYYMKVAACFIVIQIGSNFICVRFFHSFVTKSDDIPHEVAKRTLNGVIATNGYHGNQEQSDFYGNFCRTCEMDTPYRAHHCIVCKKCVLKRDHHCYFTGTCIGHYNQRYFTIMCVYVTIGCIWGLLEVIPYISRTFVPTADKWDYVLPVTCFRWLVGWISFHHMLMIWQLYSIWWMGFTTLGFASWNFFIIAQGRTSHEVKTRMRVRSMSNLAERYRIVFGPFWVSNFIFPSVLIFRQDGDGTHWPDLMKG